MKATKFIPNETDDLHCLQACVRMILSSEETETLSLAEAEDITGYRQGEQTWPYDTMLGFAKRGFEILNIEAVDQSLFVRDPAKAMIAQFGQELWEHFQTVSDIDHAREAASLCLQNLHIKFEQRVPRLDDIALLLKDNWWIIVNVNARRLDGCDGYNGHFVLVTEVDTRLTLQNPGLPPVRDQMVSRDDFIAAWDWPSDKGANILAVRKLPS